MDSLLTINNNTTLQQKWISHGFLLLKESDASHPPSFNSFIYYHQKRIALSNPFLTQIISFKSSSYRKLWRQKIRFWQSIFSVNKNILSYANHGFSIHTNLTENISTFANSLSKSETYFPVALSKNNQITGGLYIDLWKTTKNNVSSNLAQLPISVFHTGACMFGATLYGIDQFNEKHPLTEPNYRIPNNHIIEKIECNHAMHPDEKLWRSMFEISISFIKALSKSEIPTIKYHLPLSNYIWYGIIRFLNSSMTSSALTDYIKLVKHRAQEHKNYLINIAKLHSLNIETYSTLDALELDLLNENNITEALLQKIDYPTSIEVKLDNIFLHMIKFLSKQTNYVGKIWEIIQNKIYNEFESCKIDLNNLFHLNYIDYGATVALSVTSAHGGNVCAFFPSHEKSILLTYKNFFADKLGEILCANYLPSVHICTEKYYNSIFFLKEHIEIVNELLNTDITNLLALQTAAIAMDSQEYILS